MVDELSGDGYKLDDAEGILGDTQALKAAQVRPVSGLRLPRRSEAAGVLSLR